MCKCTIFGFIHSSLEGYVVYFQFWAIMNRATMNMTEHVSLFWDNTSWEYMPKIGIAGSRGRFDSEDNLGNKIPPLYNTDIHGSCLTFHSCEQ